GARLLPGVDVAAVVHLGALADALLQLVVMVTVPRAVAAGVGSRERGDHCKHEGDRDGARAMRPGLGEDRLHDATIAARRGLCSVRWQRGARSKKPGRRLLRHPHLHPPHRATAASTAMSGGGST